MSEVSTELGAEAEAEAVEVTEALGTGAQSLLAAAMLGSVGTLTVAAFGVARTKILAVEIEPAGLGRYGQVLTLLAALSAASGLGLGLGTTRVVAECRARRDRQGLGRALEVSFAVPLLIATLLAAALACGSGLLAPVLFDDDSWWLLVLAALAVPFVTLQGPLIHALQGFRDVTGTQIANVFFGIALTVTSAIGVLVAGLSGAIVALAAGNLAYAAALAWRMRSQLGAVGVRLRLRAGLSRSRLREPLIRGMLAIGFASVGVGIAATISELAVRTFVLQGDGADAAGNFQALQLISVQVVGVIVVSVVFLTFTAITESHARGETERTRRSLDDALRLSLLLTLPVIFALILLRTQFTSLFLSSQFTDVVDLLPRQLTGDALRTIAWVLAGAFVPLGMTRQWAVVVVLAVAVYIASAAVLVPAHGLSGSVDAYVIEWGTAAVASVTILWRRGLLVLGPMTVRVLLLTLLVPAAGALSEPAIPVALALLALVSIILLLLGTAADERQALVLKVRERLGR